jgi:hypothetical protein
MTVSINGTNGLVFNDGSSQATAAKTGLINRIINGAFQVWQRGTSQTTSGYGSADRWSNNHSGSTKTTSQQSFDTDQTAVPGNPKNFLRTVVSTASSSSSYVQAIQKIEDLQQFSGETVTLSFWAKADAAKNIAVELREDENDGSGALGHYFTAALTTSWQKFTITQTITAISTSVTLGANSNLGVVFWFDAGTNFSSANPITGNQSGTFDISQVQLEKGSTATSFDYRPYGTELALCQRYYSLNTPGAGRSTSTTRMSGTVGTPAPMRATPTVSLFSGTSKAIDIGVALRNVTAVVALEGATEYGGNIQADLSTTTSGVVHTYLGGCFAWSAEL